MIVSLENYVRDSTGSGVTDGVNPLTADTGFTVDALTDGRPEVAWRSPSAATSHRVHFILNESVTVGLAAAFGVRAVTAGVTVTSVSFERTGSFTEVRRRTVNSRGDCAALLTLAANDEWGLSVTLSASSKVQIDEVWFGPAMRLRKGAASIARGVVPATILNETPGGTAWAARQAAKRHRFALTFPPLTDAQDEDHETVYDALDGAYSPVVLLPDERDLTRVYHGRCSDDSDRATEADGYHYGRVIAFTESGRTI